MKIFSNFIPQERYEKRLGLKDKPITLFNDYPPKNLEELQINPINILIVNEPNEFFGIHDWAIQNQHLFNIILTWSQKVLDNCENSTLFYHGEKNIDLEYCSKWDPCPFHLEFYDKNGPTGKNTTIKTPNKIFEVSFLRGILNKIEGHHLRHRIYGLEPEVKIPHKFWDVLSDFDKEKNNRPDGKDLPNGNPIEGEGKKEVWNRNSMFHIAVENSSHRNYFTDKIVDCFCIITIPIYWGAPNIGDFYDERGIIQFKNENELIDIINNLTPEDYYSRLEFVENNYKRALQDSDYFKRLEKWLSELCKQNNL